MGLRHQCDMSALPPSFEPDLSATLADMGVRARAASRALASVSEAARTQGLRAIASAIKASSQDILEANARDIEAGKSKNLSPAMMDRLALDASRIDAMADGIEAVADLPDPVGRELSRWQRPNGLDIARVAVPLGVIGIIYESRPNVTADAGALCLRSGNAALLRCGSESINSSKRIVAAMRGALSDCGLPEDAVQLVETTDRAAVGHMLTGLGGNLDVVVPRGGRSLVERVQADARVPVIGHLEGLCHIYVDGAADLLSAKDIVVNAKMRRTGVCGAAETLLVDAAIADTFLPMIGAALTRVSCDIKAGPDALRILMNTMLPADPATDEDWRTEYLAPIIAIKVVNGLAGALDHIATYSSGHTDAVLTEDAETAETFLNAVDSAIVLHNASTQFADGGEFGMGAEIGIATGRIHARGPVGADQLTIYKYVVRGSGQIRP